MDLKYPNIAGEMAQLLVANQTTYVPKISTESGMGVLTPIPLHGDQLFEVRARNVQSTFKDGFQKLQIGMQRSISI